VSYLTHLECAACGRRHPADVLQNTCPCGGSLLARYDLARLGREAARDALAAGPPSLWRYAPLLPADDPEEAVTQREGWTPLLRARGIERALGCEAVFVKNEGANPTGTFKDRGASVAVTRARELGVKEVVLSSSGNAGVAWSAYAARAGVSCAVVLPVDAPLEAKRHCGLFGARLFALRGPWARAGALVREAAGRHGWFNVNTLQEPYRLEGKKTMGFEIAEQMGWRLPDAIVYPTGGGLGPIAIWKAFEELRALGWAEGPDPRLLVTQYAGCAPIVRAWREGRERPEPWGEIDIIPGGLRAPDPPGGAQVLRLLRRTEGAAIAVTKEEALDAAGELAREEGVLACPEGATTLAGLRRALREGLVRPGERVVLMNTGSGQRYASAFPKAVATLLWEEEGIPG